MSPTTQSVILPGESMLSIDAVVVTKLFHIGCSLPRVTSGQESYSLTLKRQSYWHRLTLWYL
jgi:hypothetical protein